MTTSNKHITVYIMPMWGHARAMCILAARMVKLRAVEVTVFAPLSYYDRVKGEITRDFGEGETHLLSRIRIVAVNENGRPHDDVMNEAYRSSWDSLNNGGSLTCAKTDTQYEQLPRPCGAVVDSFMPATLDFMHEHNPNAVKIVAWLASSASVIYFALFSHDFLPKIEEEVSRTGRPFAEVALEIFMKSKGELIRLPGLPPLYDYEATPQNFKSPPELITGVLVRVASVLNKAAGIITFDVADYHPENVALLRAHLAETSRKIYYAGPLLPHGEQAAAVEQSLSQNGDVIMDFLDKQLASRGEKSVIYISFGSLFWPTDPAKVWAVLDVLMERKIPFIMSHTAKLPWAVIPEEVQSKIAEYGDAVVSNWVPQQQVLDHPALGWCVTHGGHNSVLEIISAGIPMILYPIAADQPLNAMHLTDNLNIAYELYEVRHGVGLGPIYRLDKTPIGTIDAVKAELNDVLDRAFGADGEQKRQRVRQLRKTFEGAWADSQGLGRREVETFLDDMMQ